MMGNIAHELVSLNDHPYPGMKRTTGPLVDGDREESDLFASLDQTMDYLRVYTDKHKLRAHIRLHTEVVSVRSIDETRWSVETKDIVTSQTATSTWDAVVYAAGLWERLYFPKIDGLEELPKERLVHGRFYRSPSMFTGKVCSASEVFSLAQSIAACSYTGEWQLCKRHCSSRRRRRGAPSISFYSPPVVLQLRSRA